MIAIASVIKAMTSSSAGDWGSRVQISALRPIFSANLSIAESGRGDASVPTIIPRRGACTMMLVAAIALVLIIVFAVIIGVSVERTYGPSTKLTCPIARTNNCLWQ